MKFTITRLSFASSRLRVRSGVTRRREDAKGEARLPLVVTLLLVLALTACGRHPSKEIVIGEYGSMTGSEATFGQSTHNGIMLAVDEINARGGIQGRTIRVVSEDTQSKPEEAANAVTKLIAQDQVVAVLGEVASSNSLAAAPVCQANGVPMITPSSTHPSVTRTGDYIFRMCFIDTYQGPVMARYLRGTGIARAALLTDVRSDYSRGLGDAFAATFKSLGGTIVATQSFSKGDSDFRAQLAAIKASNPEIVFVPGYYNDVGPIAIQARDLGIAQPLVGGDGWESPKLLEIGGKSLEGCLYSNHYFVGDPAPAVQDFVRKYDQRYGAKPDSLAALGYDAMRLLGDAMSRAPKLDGRTLRDELTRTRSFAGITGTVSFGPDRNPTGKKLVMLRVKNGALTLEKTIDPQE
jgi:branched-chain amino acid transport system substrate-binding protein